MTLGGDNSTQKTQDTALHNLRGSALYIISATFILVDIFHTFLTQGMAPGLTVARIAGIVALGFFLLSPIIYRLTGKRNVAAVIFILTTLVVVLFTSLQNGGAPAPTMTFLTILPLAATILIGRLAGLISMAAVALVLGYLYIAANLGWATPSPHSPEHLRTLFTSSIFLSATAIVLIAISYERLVQATLQQLLQAKDRITKQAATQKEQNRRIQRLKQQHDLALESAGIGVWEYDIAEKALTWSEVIHDILGTHHEGGLTSGAFIEDRLHPEDVEPLKQAMTKCALDGKAFSSVFRLRKESGDYAFIEARGNALYDHSGNALSLSGSFFDVTEEYQSERLREAIWRTLLDQKDPLAVRIENVLKQTRDYYGLEAGLISKTGKDERKLEYATFSGGDQDHERHIACSQAYLAHIDNAYSACGFDDIGDSRGQNHNNEISTIQSLIAAPVFLGGKRYGVLSFHSFSKCERTFTKLDYALIELIAQWVGYEIDREQNTLLLSQSEERFALAAEGSNVGIWEWREEDGDAAYWSDNYFRLLGYAPGEITPGIEKFRNLLHPDDHDATLNTFDAHLTKRESFRAECRLRCKNGDYRWFLVLGQFVEHYDRISKRVIGSIMDINERKKVDHLKSEFVSTVSHELRTPMTSIIGALELIRSDKFGEVPPKAAELLEIAASNGRRLVRLINDILDIEKIESGKFSISMQPLYVGNLVKEAIMQNESFARDHNAVITYRDDSNGALVRGDRDRLIQVLTNLISNAAKFSGTDGKIDIRVKLVSGDVCIAVRDNGPGIPDANLDGIFERFVQLDGSDNRANEGSGLGLSIANAIVAAHNGALKVESRPGDGAVFTILLNQAETSLHESSSSKKEALPPDSTVARKKILCLDMDKDFTSVIQHLFDEFADVDAAFSATEGASRIEDAKYDLVIADPLGDLDNKILNLLTSQRPHIPAIIYSTDSVTLSGPQQNILGVYLKSAISNDALRDIVWDALYGVQDGRSQTCQPVEESA
ncbi:PAS domain-containing protein [Hyphococcus sp.]|uniref:PAS domain-containing protein n=1 Tax=Hyphococcus sp. TaxID=2038636 RepID=UPI003CCB9449